MSRVSLPRENTFIHKNTDTLYLRLKQVPYKIKVEQWLETCIGIQDVKPEYPIDAVFYDDIETESLQSVDTEQYIKSNRTKTATKVATTTIKKYYTSASQTELANLSSIEAIHTDQEADSSGKIHHELTNMSSKSSPLDKETSSGSNSQRRKVQTSHKTSSNKIAPVKGGAIRVKKCVIRVKKCVGSQAIEANDSVNRIQTRSSNKAATQPNNEHEVTTVIVPDKVSKDKNNPKRKKITIKRNKNTTTTLAGTEKLDHSKSESIIIPRNKCNCGKSTITKKHNRSNTKRNTKSGYVELDSSNSESEDILLTSYVPPPQFMNLK